MLGVIQVESRNQHSNRKQYIIMKKLIFTLCSILPLLLFTGCKEDGLLLTVNPDGSGTITVRTFMNSEAMEGMAGGLAGGLAGPGDADGLKINSDPAADIKSNVEQIGKNLGEVTLVSGKTLKNKAGWPGYEAVYSFTDANKIKLTLNPFAEEIENDDAFGGEDEMGGPGGDSNAPEYTVQFAKGAPAKLTLTAVIDEAAEAEAASKTDAEVQQEMQQAQMQAPMMAPMLAGMPSTIMVKINGSVVDSNAAITSSAGKQAFMLADMKMAEVLTDKALIAKMAKYKGGMPKETIISKGVKLQNPAEPVVVTFQ
jgi:hypothetical protein